MAGKIYRYGRTGTTGKAAPKFQELRDARTYDEAGVKRILYKFARSIGRKWNDAKLQAFIEQCFNYD